MSAWPPEYSGPLPSPYTIRNCQFCGAAEGWTHEKHCPNNFKPVAFTVAAPPAGSAVTSKMPSDHADRKRIPIAKGFLDYFPDAVIAIAATSLKCHDQHNPGSELFWDRSKSGDEADALMRHFMERGTKDTDGVRHSAKMAWRAMALLQKEIEGESATTK